MSSRNYLPKGLAAFWPMDEPTGQNRLNALDNATHVLAQAGGVAQVAGPNASIPNATGVSSVGPTTLWLSNDATLYAGGAFSCRLLAAIQAGSGPPNLMVMVQHAGSALPFTLACMENGAGEIDLYVNDLTDVNFLYGASLANQVAADGQWHDYVVTYDGTVFMVWLDATLVGIFTSPWQIPALTVDFSLGGNIPTTHTSTVHSCQGAFWGRVLGAGEVEALFNNGDFLPGPW